MFSVRHAAVLAALATAGLAQAQTLLGGGRYAPAFPIVISQLGSYKLAGPLSVASAQTSAIVV